MKELDDYTGQFQPDLELMNFSKQALVQLFRAAAKCYGGLNTYWYRAVKEKLGEDTANQLQEYVWTQGGASEGEARNVCAALSIRGNDIASYFKFLQCTPINATMFDMQFELQDNDHGALTITRCAPLLLSERNGEHRMQKHLCEVVDVLGFQIAATLFNPRMKVTATKLPPRQSRSDIACKWEFVIEQGQ